MSDKCEFLDFQNLFESHIPENSVFNEHALVINGSSENVLKTMKDKTVDLIFADPPYNIGKDFGNSSDKWKSQKAYLDWCEKWIDECFRVLKDTGTMYIMNATQNMAFIDMYISTHYNVINRIIWAYDSSGVQSKNNFGSLYEPILMVNRNKKAQYTFNSQDILIEAKTGSQRKLIDYRKDPPQPYNSKKVPGNVWTFPRVRYKMAEYENHPTQKPEALLERIIKVSSNPGDIILDPFSGSFTTSAVASRLNRYSIGIELNRDYFEIGIRRAGISNFYQGKALTKDKSRKTKNRSKRDRGAEECPLEKNLLKLF